MSKSKNVVKLMDGETTVDAPELQKRLLKALKKKADVTVDGSGVVEVDGAVLQVLVSAKKSALTKGKGLHVAEASPELASVLALTELDGIFGL